MPKGLAHHTWVWILARGILLVLLGVFATLAPGFALYVFALVFAAFSFADGVLALIGGIRAARHDGRHWGGMVLSGLAGIAIGVLFVLFPLASTLTYALLVVWLVAAWAVITGLLEVSAAIRLRQEIKGEWLLALSGTLSVLLGIALVWLLFARPAATLLSVAWLIAIYAVVAGVALIVLGMRMRRRAAGQG
ncbi:MAG TPA: DUF308 domain-containing protein [Croceibacterium sp.]|nr:DUF308 domain-containing protein [Croceibacterium sp.]